MNVNLPAADVTATGAPGITYLAHGAGSAIQDYTDITSPTPPPIKVTGADYTFSESQVTSIKAWTAHARAKGYNAGGHNAPARPIVLD